MNPARRGANHLRIVSGYASAAMVSRHIHKLVENDLHITIELIIGMTPRDGISFTDHRGFQAFVSDSFSCKYIVHTPAVHSKLYVWSNDDGPVEAYVGSANYTQTAFTNQREILTNADPTQALAYFEGIASEALHCEHSDIPHLVNIHSGYGPSASDESKPPWLPTTAGPVQGELQSATCSLLTADGTDVHQRSGLNWGQREEEAREPNQAYIPVYAPLKNTDFFPPRGVYFTAYTDDGETLTLTRAQDGDKAIQTPWNNSHLGEYFRRRLGVPSGAFVTKDDLLQYGRTDVTFYKLDDETYYMDFSVPNK